MAAMIARSVSKSAPFDGSDATYVNTNSPSDLSCHVFYSGGGGVGEQSPLTKVNNGVDWVFTGYNTIPDVGNNATADLIMIIPDISQKICLQLNDKLDIDEVSNDAPPDSDGVDTTKFIGTYSAAEQIGVPANLEGKLVACYKDESPNPDTYNFYQVLIAR